MKGMLPKYILQASIVSIKYATFSMDWTIRGYKYECAMLECDRQYNIWHVHNAYYEIRCDHCHLQSYQSGIQIFLDFSLIWNKHISAMILSIFSKKHVHDKSCIFYGWFHYCMTEYIVITTIIMINDAVRRSTIQM